ncbi:TIGR03761 family integrating conjugative element protein [Pseudomonas protegens]|jgi:integrating conjugative element protein (TIGR03761 family)|uniref:Integrating conjugative element protein, PFL_4669 family n=2 Tax=Pseudomonas protegens TaxID=380021 RepID=Q4K7N1_PSEF5|nr:TIGR03761 family integrating conjugative element protein [Pseudomonas protegens]AAY93912.1 integrating conjugative element protein, PFL_4669 family [Pseudomonas protegens Pf-5]ASE21931.1 TIGR03761 family integrating conjugative element protein [Pseudomonas protegens]QEZ54385.1 TIGR03761 family integrating conjugative element protein [Pseudomonas protegens]QEZ59413.1 TIGR03761 family integrating conjugative element protein [Pseudomonas protegens]QEZ65670.1 TIGR03761 family integrating conjug
MADNFQLNIGSLRSQVQLTLHTHHAARIWLGRQQSESKNSILGLAGFCSRVNQMDRGASQDDPFSDWWIIRIEDKIAESDAALTEIDKRLDDVMAQLPAMIDIGTNLSTHPMKLPLFISNPLGFKSVYLLTKYDEIVRRILLAKHVGLIGRRDGEVWIDDGAHILRSLFGLAQQYRFSGASRDDFAANNARAEQARQMYQRAGEIPQNILEGTRRSSFAPEIRRGQPTLSERLEAEPFDEGEE